MQQVGDSLLCLFILSLSECFLPTWQTSWLLGPSLDWRGDSFHHVKSSDPEESTKGRGPGAGRAQWWHEDKAEEETRGSEFKKATPVVFTRLWSHHSLVLHTHTHSHTPRHTTFLFVSTGGKFSTDIFTQHKICTHSFKSIFYSLFRSDREKCTQFFLI